MLAYGKYKKKYSHNCLYSYGCYLYNGLRNEKQSKWAMTIDELWIVIFEKKRDSE